MGRSVITRLLGVLGLGRRDADLDEELRFHVEMEAQENVRRGMTPEEARRAARVRVGGCEQTKEICRDQRGVPFLEELSRDVRNALRGLRANPGFTATALLTLSLGIGVNTAVFQMVHSVLFRPLPFDEPQDIVAVWESRSAGDQGRQLVSPPNFTDWREDGAVFEQVTAVATIGRVLTGRGEPRRLRGYGVTPDFFKMFRVDPIRGRAFDREEGLPGRDAVVVLSEHLWRQTFGGDPEILGRRILLDDRPRTVIGVVPDRFRILNDPDIWTPLAFPPEELTEGYRGARYLRVMARLRSGTSLAEARAHMDVLARNSAAGHPNNRGWGIRLVPLHEQLTNNMRLTLWILYGAVGFVLLIACGNVASLVLARGLNRGREIAVRAALGAGRGRILRQLATESVVLAGIGAAVGLVVAHYGVVHLAGLTPPGITDAGNLASDWRVFAYAGCLTLFTAILFGLLPGLRVSRVSLGEVLNSNGRSSTASPSTSRLHGFLVMAEVAFSVVLLTGAGLTVRSLWFLHSVDPGFETQETLTTSVSLPATRYRDEHQRWAFYEALIERLRSLPGVESVALANNLPLSGSRMTFGFDIKNRPPASPDEKLFAQYHVATPEYFRAIGIPVQAGREFEDRDHAGAPAVAIINDTLARRFFPNQDPVGHHIGVANDNLAPREIVGVVANVKHFGLATDAAPEIYVPLAQDPWKFATLLIRTRLDAGGLAPAVRAAVRHLDRDLPIGSLVPARTLIERETTPVRYRMLLLGAFALTALLLALAGIYGVTSYAVTRRRHEIGIRMALGARRHGIVTLVLRRTMALILAGLVVGLAGSLALTRFLESLIVGVTPTDPATLTAISLLLIACALTACWLPARRASRVDPTRALRCG